MPDPFSWQFTQLSAAAGSQPKTMILQGWQAPFGRPRHGAIVDAGVSVRSQATYYPGKNVPPTIHSFGTEPKPFELNGRWMDFALGAPGLAQKMRADWRDFVADEQLVRCAWGPVLSYKIFIHDMSMKFESSGDLVWELKAYTVEDENAQSPVLQVVSPTPASLASQMSDLLGASFPFTPKSYFNLRGFLSGITDAMDSIIATINAPFTFIFNTCSALSDFETAVSSDIGKMLGGLSMMRTGMLQLQDATDNFTSGAFLLNSPDAAILSDLQSGTAFFPAATMQQLTTDKAAADAANANMLALIADMRTQLLVVQRGQPQTAYVPNPSDTWESISISRLGGVDGAASIRAMNGIRYGNRPVPGKKITIPRST
jgi:hypothetical protein